MADILSAYYPYYKVQDAYYDLSDVAYLPKKICNYIIDPPDDVYNPIDDNKYPRCRLWKYLMYDGANPLSSTLPTIQQKMSVLFDPEKPDTPPTDLGYRLIPQVFKKQAQTTAQTQIYVYMGRQIPKDEYKTCFSVEFLILTHYRYDLNTQTDAYSRALAIECALTEALHGVNIAGLGTFFMSKSKHPDCGSSVFSDGDTNVGRRVTMALEIATTANQSSASFVDEVALSPDGKIRTAF